MARRKGRHARERLPWLSNLGGTGDSGRHVAAESDPADHPKTPHPPDGVPDDAQTRSSDEKRATGPVPADPLGPAAFSRPPARIDRTGPVETETVDTPQSPPPAEPPTVGRHERPRMVDDVMEHTEIATGSGDIPAQGPHQNTAVDLGFEIVIDDRDASAADRAAAERYLDRLVVGVLDSDGAGEADPEHSPHATGLLLITLGHGGPSAAETLARMVETDLPSMDDRTERGLHAVLGGRISAWQLHRWLERRFFEHHLQLTSGNPVVWHVSTPSGAFQVLARARDLDPERLAMVRTWARTTEDRLGRALGDAGRAGDVDLVESIRTQLDEVRSIDRMLGDMVRNGWRVGGELDRAAKLAVLQSRGAVRFPEPATTSGARSHR